MYRLSGGLIGKAVEFALPDIKSGLDQIDPATSEIVMKIDSLLQGEGEITSHDVVTVVVAVVDMSPDENDEFTYGNGAKEVRVSRMLSLGPSDLKLGYTRFTGFAASDLEAQLYFKSPLDDVEINLDPLECNTYRWNGSSTRTVDTLLNLGWEKENNYADQEDEAGFSDFDRRILLQAVREAVVLGEESTYWEEAVQPMLRLEELREFNHSFALGIAQERGIPAEVINASLTIPTVETTVAMIEKADRLTRFDLFDKLTRRGRKLQKDLFEGNKRVF